MVHLLVIGIGFNAEVKMLFRLEDGTVPFLDIISLEVCI